MKIKPVFKVKLSIVKLTFRPGTMPHNGPGAWHLDSCGGVKKS